MKWCLVICVYIFTISSIFGLAVNQTNPKNETSPKNNAAANNSNQIDVESIKKDILDILHLIPSDKIITIALKHLAEDDEFKLAVQYMMSEEWVQLIQEVKRDPDWIAFKAHLSSFGIPIETFIHCLDSFVKNVSIGPITNKDAKRNLTNFIQEIESVIPMSEILLKFNEKMQTSPNIQFLLEKMSSPESRKIFESALSLPSVKKMLGGLKDMGLNLYDLFSLIYIFFGWGELKV